MAVFGLISGVAKLLLEIVALVAAIGLVAAPLSRLVVRRGTLVIATTLVVGVVAATIAVQGLAQSGKAITQAHRATGETGDGIDECFVEDGAGSLIPFLRIVRARVPPRAVYVATVAGKPDLWCVALALLPRLPAFGDDHAQWVIALGAIPPSMQALIDRHDPSVTEYAPGLAIQRLGGR